MNWIKTLIKPGPERKVLPTRTRLISPNRPARQNALVVQCFVKLDTLQNLCDSLLRCDAASQFDLIFWSDHPHSAKFGTEFAQKKYIEKNQHVLDFLQRFKARARGFNSVSIHTNPKNLGTCKTCRASLDHAFSKHEFVIFAEDDTVFSRDALTWFLNAKDQGLLDPENVLTIAGESIYFDTQRSELPADYDLQALDIANRRQYLRQYTTLPFVPSTCFATTRSKWAGMAGIRGQREGANDLCQYCADHGQLTVFPIIARVRDVGMLHSDGHSVRILGADNVVEIKNTYLTSDQLDPLEGKLVPLPPDSSDQLYWESVLLNGFAETASQPS